MIDYLWEQVCTHDVPYSNTLTPEQREDIEVLAWYIQDYLEKWFTNNRLLPAFSIVRLISSSHEIMLEIRRLNGKAPVYFKELRNVRRRVLRRLHVREARQILTRACITSSDITYSN